MIHTIADITPNSTATALIAANVRTPAKWVMFTATGTTIRVGDSSVGTAQGVQVPASLPTYFHPIGDIQYLDLSQVFVYGTGTDKISITYAL